MHIFEAQASDQADSHSLENYFSPELMDGICRANRVCRLEDMLAMGLQTNPSQLAGLTAITLPLGTLGSSYGFILLYRSSDQKELEPAILRNLSAVRHGLSQAIASCQQLARLTE